MTGLWQCRDSAVAFPSFRVAADDAALAQFRDAMTMLRTPEALSLIWMDVQRQVLFDKLRNEGLFRTESGGLGTSWPQHFVALRDEKITPEEYFTGKNKEHSVYFFLVQASQATELLRAWRDQLPLESEAAEQFIIDYSYSRIVDTILEIASFENREAGLEWINKNLMRDWRTFNFAEHP